jgi:hypothetical protein
MKTWRLARRLGLDGNPLRRRSDKITACAAVLLLAAFLTGAPFLSVAAAGWAGRPGDAQLRAERSWHQVSAVLLRATPAPNAADGVLGYSLVLARWRAPGGGMRTGRIPVSAHLAAGRAVRLWVDAAGAPTGPPLSHRMALVREATAAAAATVVLGIFLLCVALAGRLVFDRRRLAAWEAAWAAVGPQWTRRFRMRG